MLNHGLDGCFPTAEGRHPTFSEIYFATGDTYLH